MNATEYEDKQIIQRSIDLLNNDEYIIFCIVARTWGSSPRPPGSLMMLSQNGIMTGSVSGGCIEDDLQHKLQNGFFDDKKITRLVYGSDDDENEHVRIPCGSILEIVAEKITDSKQLNIIYNSLVKGETISRTLIINDGASSLEINTGKNIEFSYDGKSLKKNFGSAWCVLIIGSSDLSSYVAAIGKMLGYRIVICEPRESYRPNWTDEDCEITSLMPDDAVRHYATNFYSIVLSLSHDPKLDDMALMAALDLDLFYVGAIGSEKNNLERKKRLKELGLSKGSIAKLHAPVGLNISSRMPAEISVSIFAELINLRNKLKTTNCSLTDL